MTETASQSRPGTPIASRPSTSSYLDHPFPLASAEVRQDPFPYYRWLRENDPCAKSGGVWLISRFEDVNAMFRDRRLSSDLRKADDPILTGALRARESRERSLSPLARATALAGGAFNRIERGLMGWLNQFSMIGLDAPDHGRMRGLVRSAFTPRAVARMESQIESRVDQLLDEIQADRGGHRFDLISRFGYPLPLQVVSDMLGIPTQEERRMREWSDALSRAVDPATSTAVRRRGFLASIGFNRYIAQLIGERRKAPGDDLLSALIEATDGQHRLSQAELIGNTVLLIVAGHETTTNLIGNGTFALLRNPEQLELLRADASLAPAAVEEILRFDSPGQLAYRTALEPIELHGKTIQPGEQMILLMGSANRDPEVFDDADRLDIARDRPNNIAFGAGPHHCLGAALARLEGKIALPALLERGEIELATEPRYRDNLVHRGLTDLQVRLG